MPSCESRQQIVLSSSFKLRVELEPCFQRREGFKGAYFSANFSANSPPEASFELSSSAPTFRDGFSRPCFGLHRMLYSLAVILGVGRRGVLIDDADGRMNDLRHLLGVLAFTHLDGGTTMLPCVGPQTTLLRHGLRIRERAVGLSSDSVGLGSQRVEISAEFEMGLIVRVKGMVGVGCAILADIYRISWYVWIARSACPTISSVSTRYPMVGRESIGGELYISRESKRDRDITLGGTKLREKPLMLSGFLVTVGGKLWVNS